MRVSSPVSKHLAYMVYHFRSVIITWDNILSEKLAVAYLVSRFPNIYEIRKVITLLRITRCIVISHVAVMSAAIIHALLRGFFYHPLPFVRQNERWFRKWECCYLAVLYFIVLCAHCSTIYWALARFLQITHSSLTHAKGIMLVVLITVFVLMLLT